MHFSLLPIETMYLKPLIAKDQHFEHGSNIYGIVELFPGLWCMCISEKSVCKGRSMYRQGEYKASQPIEFLPTVSFD